MNLNDLLNTELHDDNFNLLNQTSEEVLLTFGRDLDYRILEYFLQSQ